MKKGDFGKKALQDKCPKGVCTGCGFKAGRRPGGLGVVDPATEKMRSEFTLGQIRTWAFTWVGKGHCYRTLSRKEI